MAGTKVIAEAWDASGLYQVGKFVEGSDRFAEWNGPYRDDVRCFVKSDRGIVSRLAARVMGSPDIYLRPDYEPNHHIWGYGLANYSTLSNPQRPFSLDLCDRYQSRW
ncbi:MAG: hypothetical protein V7L11_28160 [Nostoc sp.]|uniref:hypothetical protein n=1 Tax=Nostoc sp. TaxID=1180 RepID=UPI002FF6E099